MPIFEIYKTNPDQIRIFNICVDFKYLMEVPLEKISGGGGTMNLYQIQRKFFPKIIAGLQINSKGILFYWFQWRELPGKDME